MSGRRRLAVPIAAGLAAAAVAFALVAVLSDDDGRAARPASTTSEPAAASGDAESGRDCFASMGCGGCHKLDAAGSKGPIGPDLDAALAGHTRNSLVAKISDPGASSMMPGDFAQRMSAREMDALVRFLLDARD